METLDRLKKIISENEGKDSSYKTDSGSKARFCKKTGISSSLLAHWLCGRNKTISDAMASKICSAYSVRVEWLQTGVGEMYDRSDRSLLTNTLESSAPIVETITISIEKYESFLELRGEVRALKEQLDKYNRELLGALRHCAELHTPAKSLQHADALP